MIKEFFLFIQIYAIFFFSLSLCVCVCVSLSYCRFSNGTLIRFTLCGHTLLMPLPLLYNSLYAYWILLVLLMFIHSWWTMTVYCYCFLYRLLDSPLLAFAPLLCAFVRKFKIHTVKSVFPALFSFRSIGEPNEKGSVCEREIQREREWVRVVWRKEGKEEGKKKIEYIDCKGK